MRKWLIQQVLFCSAEQCWAGQLSLWVVEGELTAAHLTHYTCSWIYRRRGARRESTVTNEYKLQVNRQCCDNSWEWVSHDRLNADYLTDYLGWLNKCAWWLCFVSMHGCIYFCLIIIQAQGGSLIRNTTRAEQKTSVLHRRKPAEYKRIQRLHMATILGCSWHLDNKKEAHASFIRQCKSNMKDVALFLSVITTRFGLNHEKSCLCDVDGVWGKVRPVVSHHKRTKTKLREASQNEDQISKSGICQNVYFCQKISVSDTLGVAVKPMPLLWHFASN